MLEPTGGHGGVALAAVSAGLLEQDPVLPGWIGAPRPFEFEATTLQFSQLNLGHLIHQQDNTRGSFRGHGFELRTDGYAAVMLQNGKPLAPFAIDASTGVA